MSNLVLEKLVSGGQTGADQASLRAGRRLGLETGGWAPRGWRTLAGLAPWLADYGLAEYHSSAYAGRTAANVRDSDATVRFARDFFSPGERCTLKAINSFKRPYHDVHVDWIRLHEAVARGSFVKFLVDNKVKVLNVAGNSEETAPGIGRAVEEFLVRALSRKVSP